MNDAPHITEQKKQARELAQAVRAKVHGELAGKAAQALVETGIGFAGAKPGCVVSAFIPFGDEIDTRPLLSDLTARGFTTCVPVVVKLASALEFRQWAPEDTLVEGRWNIPVPPDTAPVLEPDVLLVPLLAFDRRGYRLGYGGGFYDRTLEGLRAKKPIVAVGVAYAAQEVDEVVCGPYDQQLDWLLTEKGAREVEHKA